MKTFYLPALGYSETETSRWLTVRLYERVDGVYIHDYPARIGTWRRAQQSAVENEVRANHFALLNLIEKPKLDGYVVLVAVCLHCGAVQEQRIERGTYAVQCPGCKSILLTEDLLRQGAVTGDIGEIDKKLSARMRRLAALQGYTVGVGD